MKRRVRIYQMGGANAMQNVGNVDSGPSEDELVSAAMTMIGEQQATPDEVLNTFVKNGIQPDKANQVIASVVEYINHQTELGNAQLTDSNERQVLEEEDLARQEEGARLEQEEARRKQMYQDMYADEGSADYSDDDQVASEILMKYGGLPNKKTFIKNIFALAKKQTGGEGTSSKGVDDKSFGHEKSGLNAFVRSAQNSANNALMKKDAEAMYSSLQPYFQDGGDTESGVMDFDPYHNLAHYSDTFEHAMPTNETEVVQAQFGGMRPGQQRRMQRRINKMIGQVPAAMYNSRQSMFPQGINIMTMPMMGPQAYALPAYGSYQGGPQLANIDVRKVGLFGKPKEYSITFAQEAYNNPQLRQNVIRQEQVNEETTVKEIATEQKASETNTATTENKEVLAEKEKASGAPTTKPVKTTTSAKPITVKKDAWGRSEEDPWYGFNPETKSFDTDPAVVNRSTGVIQQVIDRANKYPDSNIFKPAFSNFQNATADQYLREHNAKMLEWTKNIQPKTGLNPANPEDLVAQFLPFVKGLGQFTFKGAPKGYLPGAKGLPKGPGSFSAPSNWTGAPKGLPYSGTNVRYVPPGGFQEGGFTDPNSGLYKFINGGNDMSMIEPQGKITDDPYFQSGGYFQTAGQTDSTPVEIIDNNGNVVRTTTLADAEKNNLRHRVIKSNTQTTDPNIRRYNALKELGYNVGDFREGVDYSKIGNNTTTQQQGQQQQYPNYYNPEVGAMYPPLFGGRQYGPPGKTIQYAGSWLQQQGLPIDPRTGKAIQGITNPQLKSIDVTKSSLLRKLPKEYTMNFTGQAPEGTGFGTFNTGFQPRKDWNTPQTVASSKSDQKVPGAFGPRNDEFMQNLWKNRAKRKGYDVDWSTDETVSPENLQTVDNRLPAPQFTDQELGYDQLIDVQPEIFAPEFTDKELGFDQLIDVQPETFNTPNQQDNTMFMQTRPAQTLNSNINNFEPTPLEINQATLNQYTQDIPLSNNISGPQSEDNALYEQYRNQDLIGSGMSLLGVPTINDEYTNTLGNQNSLSKQNFDLDQMYRQDPNYYNRAPYSTPLDVNSLDYTQQVGPTAPIINSPVNAPRQRRNIERPVENIKNNTRKEIKEPTRKEIKPAPIKNNTPLGPGGSRSNQYDVQLAQERGRNMKADRELYNLYLKEYRDSNKTMSEFKKDNPAAYKRMFGTETYQYGGYLPEAQTGLFTTNQNMTGYSDINSNRLQTKPKIELASAESMMTNPFTMDSDYKNPLSGDSPTIRMGTDGEYVNEGVLTDEDLAKLNQRDMSVDYKVKNMYNVDFEKGVNQFNRGINQGLAMFGERGDSKRRADLQNNLTGDNLYGSTGIQNRGTYETNSGLFRPDEMGFKGIVRDGGYMQDGGDIYNQDDETWMSKEQIQKFLAEGGELEFI